MRDVAKRAGVSTSTVSHVVNGTRFVAGDLVARVHAAMEELGYRPNALARSLRRKETQTLGMIVPDNANPFYAAMARAIEDMCFERRYSLILANSAGDTERELRNVSVLLARQVDGLIFVATGMGDEDLVKVLSSIPVVLVDRDLASSSEYGGPLQVDSVMTDNLTGGYEATRYLLGLGHARIGCITGRSTTSPSSQRTVGYRRALAEAGVAPDEKLIVRGDFRFESGFSGAQQLLSRPARPTAIFASSDRMAVGAIAAAAELGLAVPGEVSIIGFDGVDLGAYTIPPLTTMVQPISRIGQLATELLLRRIARPDRPPERAVLPVTLLVRKSTAPPGPIG